VTAPVLTRDEARRIAAKIAKPAGPASPPRTACRPRPQAPSDQRARPSIRAHSFQKKICRINARNHLVRLSALATSGPFAPLLIFSLASQDESGAHAWRVAPSHRSAAPDCTLPPENSGRLRALAKLQSCTKGSLKSCSIETIC